MLLASVSLSPNIGSWRASADVNCLIRTFWCQSYKVSLFSWWRYIHCTWGRLLKKCVCYVLCIKIWINDVRSKQWHTRTFFAKFNQWLIKQSNRGSCCDEIGCLSPELSRSGCDGRSRRSRADVAPSSISHWWRQYQQNFDAAWLTADWLWPYLWLPSNSDGCNLFLSLWRCTCTCMCFNAVLRVIDSCLVLSDFVWSILPAFAWFVSFRLVLSASVRGRIDALCALSFRLLLKPQRDVLVLVHMIVHVRTYALVRVHVRAYTSTCSPSSYTY